MLGHMRALREQASVVEKSIPNTDTRGYLYPDGRAVMRLRLTVPKNRRLEDFLIADVQDAIRFAPEGTFYEGNFLLADSDKPREGYARWRGVDRIQTHPHTNANLLVVTLVNIAATLRARGFKQPSHVMIRMGRTPNARQKPFRRGRH
jgi:hypothetical protein